jgi:cytochrome c oxidase cbb3-type subunit III
MFWRSGKLPAVGSACVAALFLTASYSQTRSPSPDSAFGQQIFSNCASCHGLDGRGGEHAPNIATDPKVKRMPDAAILGVIRNGIPAAGMPGFSKSLDEKQIHGVLKYLRELQDGTNMGQSKGNAAKGRELFFGRMGCAGCHAIDGRGGFFGPDLSGYGSSHSPAEIGEAIVDPNRNLEARRATVTVLTRSGKRYSGLIRNEDNFSLQMQTADGLFHLFDRSELSHIEHQANSLMPSDYGSKLTRSELNDLISFLLQTGGSHKEEPDNDQE